MLECTVCAQDECSTQFANTSNGCRKSTDIIIDSKKGTMCFDGIRFEVLYE